MSDSTENTNELDNYGVWIKRPPQDAEESTFDIADTQNETDNMACLGAENEVSLDDFDFPNLNEDSAEENSAEEEVSLDDFIDASERTAFMILFSDIITIIKIKNRAGRINNPYPPNRLIPLNVIKSPLWA